MTFWEIALAGAWVAILLDLLLTLRVVRWIRATAALNEESIAREHAEFLRIDAKAPDFRARTLAGEAVGLDDYEGRAVALVFVSPHCGTCRREVRGLVRLARTTRQSGIVEIVLVSDSRSSETSDWLRDIHDRDGVTVDLPVIIAPTATSDLILKYNPRGLTPYFCLVDSDGVVRARDPVGLGHWPVLRALWERSHTARRADPAPI
jgi:hypothetical protein